MPLFDYTGQLGSGATFQGTLEAAAQDEAEATLTRLGVRVTTLRPARRTGYVAPLSLDEFTFFNEQLAALTQSQLPLEEGLRQLAADVGSRKLKRLLLELAGDLAAGTPLEAALQRQQGRFPPQYPAVVEAGLRTGDVAGTLYGLTTHLRLKSHLRRTLLELAVYPLLVLVLTFLISSLIMRYVIPTLAAVLTDLRAELYFGRSGVPYDPHDTGGVIFWLAHVWPTVEIIFVAPVVLLIAGFALTYLPGGHRIREALIRHMPGFAQVYWSSVLARFAHTSALAAFSGTPLPELITASGAASGSPALTQATQRVAERLSQGESLTAAAADERDVPALWTCAVAVAAPRGDLPATLTELARAYELRAQHWVSTLRALLGPLLFLIVAIGVGGIVVFLLSGVNVLLRTLMGAI